MKIYEDNDREMTTKRVIEKKYIMLSTRDGHSFLVATVVPS